MAEQQNVLTALQTAIQMETDGKKFYLKASRQSSNEAGRKLLRSLADEEDKHRQDFEQIYEAMRRQKAWPQIEARDESSTRLKTLFAGEAKKLGTTKKALAMELDAIKTAMDMENKTYDFYKAQAKSATYDAEKKFYEALAAQEKGHHLVLLDYFEFLKDPAAWFVKIEHPHLDGG